MLTLRGHFDGNFGQPLILTKMEQKTVQEIVAKYHAGVKVAVIQREYGLSRGGLYKILSLGATKPDRNHKSTGSVAEFGTCLFHEYPAKGCDFTISPSRECVADDWDIVECFMQHYGLPLRPDAAIRIMDSMVHLILANDEAFERGGDYD